VTTQLGAILTHESLNVDLQPIVSVRRQAVVGVESLARARQVSDGGLVAPLKLFEWAAEEDQILEVDRLCRKRALEAFAALTDRDPDLLLFMNLEVSILDRVSRTDFLVTSVHAAGLDPANVVIEINESAVRDPAALKDFVGRYRAMGFLIALDDLGAGHSNLQRWPQLQPDIIKVDRSLIDGLSGDYFRQEVLRSLSALGRQTGALVLAEGVETQEDLEACLDIGVDLYQGYYFSRPMPSGSFVSTGAMKAMEGVVGRHRVRSVTRMKERRREFEMHRDLLRDLASRLFRADSSEFDSLLHDTISTKKLECLFILDDKGIQVSGTVFPREVDFRHRGALFHAAQQGTDHSAKDYFFGLIEAGLKHFISEPYLSMATGNMCRTLSMMMPHCSGQGYVLCADLRVEQGS
jgi:EAL domain-containing protein (putative c-di-GMP-specific phosphodiesterase class I)